MKKIYLGAAYYPELWDEAEQEKDVARCKELGVNVLRMGEFAWSKMEPREGEYELGWLKNVVRRLHKNGISTVMCTPTCTPPRWLLNKYPEMRVVEQDGKRADVSSRCHVCKSSPVAREKNRQIVTAMARELAGEEGIIGWQIDNEIFPYGDGCYCENCKQAFRDYLKERFGTVERLNKTWGMARWSLEYASFDEVEPPYSKQWRHPSLRTAWWNFQCGLIKDYVEEQAEILHSFGCKNVGTDMMPNNNLGYYSLNEKLDVVQYNHYEPSALLGDTAFAYDFLRCVKDKPFWVTETQVGWNGSEYAACGYRPEGACYINTLLPLAKGAEMNMYWLFRAHPNGHELGHGALLSAAGRSYRVTEEVTRAKEKSDFLGGFLTESFISSDIALHYSCTATNSLSAAPVLENLNYRKTLMEGFHRAFRHYNIDVIDTPHSLKGYKVLVSPFLATLEEHGFAERVTEWVKAGGTWIAGPMTDIMNAEVTRYTHAPYGILEELVGVYTKYQKPIDNDVFEAEWEGGGDCPVSACFDAYEVREGTKALARYRGGEFDGLAVIAERRVGKGRVILLGSMPSHETLRRLAGLQPILKASDNLNLTKRTNGGIAVLEVEGKAGFLALDGEYTEASTGRKLAGSVEVKPYEALFLEKK